MTNGSFFSTGPAKTALISPCGLYRYTLRRTWDNELPVINWIMLNPSTADAMVDDPTIRKCLSYSRKWGYGVLVVTNLFAFRATDPAAMKAAADPVGPGNDDIIQDFARASERVVVAWGNHGAYRGRSDVVLKLLANAGVVPWFLSVTNSFEPGHPLFLKGAARLREWRDIR